MRLDRVATLATVRLVNRRWFRAVPARFAATPHLSAHTATQPGRFNGGTVTHPAHEAIYLCDDRVVCLFEVGAVIGAGQAGGPLAVAPTGAGAWSGVAVRISLRRVVDLTRATARRRVATTAQELSGDWQGYRRRNPFAVYGPPYHTPVPTQRLGAALFAAPGVEGALFHSAKLADHVNLVVFPAKLDPTSSLEFFDDRGILLATIP